MNNPRSKYDSVGYVNPDSISIKNGNVYFYDEGTDEEVETVFSESELIKLIEIVNIGKRLRRVLLRSGATKIVDYLNFYIPLSFNLSERDSTLEVLVRLASRIKQLLEYIKCMDLPSYINERRREGSGVIEGPGTIIFVRESELRDADNGNGADHRMQFDFEELRSDASVIRNSLMRQGTKIVEELRNYMNALYEFAGEA